MSTLDRPMTSTVGETRAAPRYDIGRYLGWFAVRAVLIIICVVWTLPTLGLFISSLRNPEALANSGWWTALRPTTEINQERTGTEPTDVDGRYVISGNVLEGLAGAEQVDNFGLTANAPTEYGPGEVADLGDGLMFTMDGDGNYELFSSEPFTLDRGQRFFFESEIPPSLSLNNYEEVLSGHGIADAFVNTATVTIPATVIPIAIAAFAAYAFSWMEFPGRRFLFIVVVGLIVVPLQMSLIPLQRLYSSLGIGGSYPGIWLAHTGFGLPLAIFLLRNYIAALPREIIESAHIDGATHYQIFTRLVVPLSIPALASFAIFQFLWVWNDLLVALVFLGIDPDREVLTKALAALVGSRGENWEIMTAAAFVSIIVPLMVFFALQRYFVRGLLAGSVKGG